MSHDVMYLASLWAAEKTSLKNSSSLNVTIAKLMEARVRLFWHESLSENCEGLQRAEKF